MGCEIMFYGCFYFYFVCIQFSPVLMFYALGLAISVTRSCIFIWLQLKYLNYDIVRLNFNCFVFFIIRLCILNKTIDLKPLFKFIGLTSFDGVEITGLCTDCVLWIGDSQVWSSADDS